MTNAGVFISDAFTSMHGMVRYPLFFDNEQKVLAGARSENQPRSSSALEKSSL